LSRPRDNELSKPVLPDLERAAIKKESRKLLVTPAIYARIYFELKRNGMMIPINDI
jgi:hypothetical protein